MQSIVIVLLKLLLATVTANNTHAAMNGNGEDDHKPNMSLPDTDIMRHREITSKAVSAILILMLKWFKTSHVMKFHYLSHLLVDSNCLLLILKMFGLQEVSTLVRTRHEHEDRNFFRYCYLYGSKNPQAAQADDARNRGERDLRPAPVPPPGVGSEDEEIEYITEYSWRNFFSVTNFIHILHKLTKRRIHRVLLLVQYKSSAILKRILKVNHPTLQRYVLKVIKSQIPYCGRKWRGSNMKVITAIYLNCRPDLRDEWLAGGDIDSEVEDSLPHENALRALVRFFNTKHYGAFAPQLTRKYSTIHTIGPNGAYTDGQPPASPLNYNSSTYSSHSNSNPFETEAFPPTRPMHSFDDHYRTGYIPDTLMEGYLEDYEELLGDLLYPRYSSDGTVDADAGGDRLAWTRLGEILGETDDISDTESVASIGYLGGFGSDEGGNMDEQSENATDWEHMSPGIIAALEEERVMGSPRSPRTRRGSSGPRSPALRPVMSDADDYEEAMAAGRDPAPMPKSPHAGPAVDEVEAVWGRPDEIQDGDV